MRGFTHKLMPQETHSIHMLIFNEFHEISIYIYIKNTVHNFINGRLSWQHKWITDVIDVFKLLIDSM